MNRLILVLTAAAVFAVFAVLIPFLVNSGYLTAVVAAGLLVLVGVVLVLNISWRNLHDHFRK